MNAEQRAALRRLAKEATPGERSITREGFSTVYVEARIGGGMLQEIAAFGPCHGGQVEQVANADLCAAANPSAILQLLDYIETLEKDAARYRWLRDTCMDDPKTRLAVMNGFIDYETVDYIYGEGLDVAIDAAMQGETE